MLDQFWPFCLLALALPMLASALIGMAVVIPGMAVTVEELRQERRLLKERVAGEAHLLFLQQRSLHVARQIEESLRVINGEEE